MQFKGGYIIDAIGQIINDERAGLNTGNNVTF